MTWTPPILNMLASELLKKRYIKYLEKHIELCEKEVKQVLRKLSKTYNNPQVEELYRGLYKEFYGEEILIEEMDISNPSSGGSSSFIK